MNVYVYVCDLRTLNVILINQIYIDVIYFVLWNSANLKFEQMSIVLATFYVASIVPMVSLLLPFALKFK